MLFTRPSQQPSVTISQKFSIETPLLWKRALSSPADCRIWTQQEKKIYDQARTILVRYVGRSSRVASVILYLGPSMLGWFYRAWAAEIQDIGGKQYVSIVGCSWRASWFEDARMTAGRVGTFFHVLSQWPGVVGGRKGGHLPGGLGKLPCACLET